MSYQLTETLLQALKVRKGQLKDGLDTAHEWSKKLTPVVDGTDSVFQISKSSLKTGSTPIPDAGQIALSSTGFFLGLITTIPAIVAIATSKEKSAWDKCAEIFPLVLTTLFSLTAMLLGFLFLIKVGTIILATAGSAVGLAGAAFYLGFMTYKLYKAYVAAGVAAKALDAAEALEKENGPPDNTALLEEIVRLEGELATLVKSSSETYSDDELDAIQAKLNKLHEIKQTILDQSVRELKRKDHIAKENVLAALVNLGLAITGVLIATIGLMLLVAVTIPAPPLIGIILAGIGVGLSVFGLIKSGVELKFSWDEAGYVETNRSKNDKFFLDEAFKKVQPEMPIALEPAIDLTTGIMPQEQPNSTDSLVVLEPQNEPEAKAQTRFTSEYQPGFYKKNLDERQEKEISGQPTLNVGTHGQ